MPADGSPALFLNEAHLHLMRRLQHNIRMQPRMLAVHEVLNPAETLQQPHKCVSHLCKCELLSNADAWATIEGNVCPRFGRPRIPTSVDTVSALFTNTMC